MRRSAYAIFARWEIHRKKTLTPQAELNQYVDLYQSDPGVAAIGLMDLLSGKQTDSALGAAIALMQAAQTIVSFAKSPPVLRVKTDA